MSFSRSVFTLRHALRCHSLHDDPEDLATVWDAAFPSIADSDFWLATCGGDTVCFTACTTGLVKARYRDGKGDEFYCLAWTDFGDEHPVLAAAGKHGSIKLLSPVRSACYLIAYGVNLPVHSLAFHYSDSTRLLSAHAAGVIALWDIGDTDAATEVQLLRVFRVDGGLDVMAASLGGVDGIVGIAGGADGCLWTLDLADVIPEDELDNPSQTVRDEVPAGSFPRTGASIIDCIEAIGSTHYAYKAACDGQIILRELQGPAAAGATVARLRFPSTLVFFLRFCVHRHEPPGYDRRTAPAPPSIVVAAGDEAGQIHLHELEEASLVKGAEHRPARHPDRILTHPLSSKALRRVRVSPSGMFVVAVNDENVVFIWERTPSLD